MPLSGRHFKSLPTAHRLPEEFHQTKNRNQPPPRNHRFQQSTNANNSTIVIHIHPTSSYQARWILIGKTPTQRRAPANTLFAEPPTSIQQCLGHHSRLKSLLTSHIPPQKKNVSNQLVQYRHQQAVFIYYNINSTECGSTVSIDTALLINHFSD